MNNIAASLFALSRIGSSPRVLSKSYVVEMPKGESMTLDELVDKYMKLVENYKKLQTVIEKEKNDNGNSKRDTKTSKVSKSSKK